MVCGLSYAHYPDFAWIEATVLGLGRPIRSYPKLPGRQKIVENHVVIGSCHRCLPWLNSSFLCGVCWHSYFVLNPTLVHYSWGRLNQIPSFNWQNWKVSSWSSSPHLTAFFLPLAKKAPLIAAESRYQGIYHVLSARRIPFLAVGFHSNNIAKYCKNRWGSPDIVLFCLNVDSNCIFLRQQDFPFFLFNYLHLPEAHEDCCSLDIFFFIYSATNTSRGAYDHVCIKSVQSWTLKTSVLKVLGRLAAGSAADPPWQQSRETASEIRLNWRWTPGKKFNQA